MDAEDLLTRSTVKLRCSDISLSGCYLDTLNPMDLGTPVWVRLVHGGHVFESQGKVAYAVPRLGMGVTFALRQQRFALAYSLVPSAIRVCNRSALTLLS